MQWPKSNISALVCKNIECWNAIPGGIIIEFTGADDKRTQLRGMTPELCDKLIEKAKELKELLEHYDSLSEKERGEYWENI